MSATLIQRRPREKHHDISAETAVSPGSWAGLCAASFFLAEINGVTMPFLNTYLQDSGWRFDSIGSLAALAGLVSLVVHLPGGFLIDRFRHSRVLLAAASLIVGGAFGFLALVPATRLWVGVLLVTAAVGKPFFGPLTNALTLGLVGHNRLDRALGINQAWNHAGNIAAALTAMALVSLLPVASVFFAVAAASVCAASSALLIRPSELDERRASGLDQTPVSQMVRLTDLLKDRRLAVLLGAAVLFHLANAPVMPLVAQKVRHVGGSNGHVAAVVLVAQSVMIPVAILAGLLAQRFGHKRILAVGFAVLPVRIALYAVSDDPVVLVAIQALDGVGAGIFGVTAVAVCAEATRGRGRFNALAGTLATAVGMGGAVGPLVSGFVVQNWGFAAAFAAFAIVATVAAVPFFGWMPEPQSVNELAELNTPAPACIFAEND